MNESKPFDLEAFIAGQESGLRSGHLLFRADVVERLIVAVRDQQTKIADLELANGMNRLAAKGLGDTASRAMTGNAFLRARLSRLEALLVRANDHYGLIESSERCECEGCVLARDIAEALSSSASDLVRVPIAHIAEADGVSILCACDDCRVRP